MRLIFTLLLASAVSSIWAAQDHLPLPPQIMTAKTVYIENKGPAKLGDRAYAEITRWGHFRVVTDRTKADLILSLSTEISGTTVRTFNNGRVNSNTDIASSLHVLDLGGVVLWSDQKGTIKRAIDELRKRIEEQAADSARVNAHR